MIKFCSQEIIGYQFSFIQRSRKMIKYVYALNCFYETEISTHTKVAAILRQEGNLLYHKHTITLHSVPLKPPPQYISKDQFYAINTIVPPILKNSIIQYYHPFKNKSRLDSYRTRYNIYYNQSNTCT